MSRTSDPEPLEAAVFLHKVDFFFPFFPTASSRVQHAKEVCPCRTERQAAHAEAFRTRAHGGPKESCSDPVPGQHEVWGRLQLWRPRVLGP